MTALLKAEYLKNRRRYIFLTELALTAAAGAWAFYGSYTGESGSFALENGYMLYLYQLPLINTIFFPLMCTLIASRMAETEHSGGGFRRLCVRSTDAAGGQGAEGAAERENIGTGNGIKHLGALIKRGVVDILNAAQQRHITDVAVHSQRARTDADNALIAARRDGHFAAYHVGNGDLFRLCCREFTFSRRFRCRGFRRGEGGALAAAGAERQQHYKCQDKCGDLLSFHIVFLPILFSDRHAQ